ncbi:MAG: hypothetical protein GXX92_12590 [Clostridiales bacterium]|nr:hypothetical protein [Clostridiales bacterium]
MVGKIVKGTDFNTVVNIEPVGSVPMGAKAAKGSVPMAGSVPVVARG